MKNKIAMLVIIMILQIPLIGEEINDKIMDIKSSNAYYFGSGEREDYREAFDYAISQLSEQISINVKSNFENRISQVDGKASQNATKIIKTQSMTKITNFEKIVTKNGDKVSVFCYIKKSDLNKIFEERKRLIFELYKNAKDMEKDLNIKEALKYTYFAMILTASIPDERVEVEGVNLGTEIPNFIKKMFLGINISVVKRVRVKTDDTELDEVNLSILYNGKEVSELQFDFFDGMNYLNVNAKNGKTIIELYDKKAKKLPIRIHYEFSENKEEIKAVADIWEMVNRMKYTKECQMLLLLPEAIKDIEIKSDLVLDGNLIKENNRDEKAVEVKSENIASITNSSITDKISDTVQNVEKDTTKNINKEKSENNIKKNKAILSTTVSAVTIIKNEKTYSNSAIKGVAIKTLESCNILTEISNSTNMLINSIKNGKFDYFVKDKFLEKKLNKIYEYNKIKLLSPNMELKLEKNGAGWELRSIPTKTLYKDINKVSTENLVVDFNEQGEITDVNFAIFDNLYDNFKSIGEISGDWKNREVIVKFVEKYRTAFMTRDIETVDKIFSDKAVIIIGRVLSNVPETKENPTYILNEEGRKKIQYTRYDKKTYIRLLDNLFKNKMDLMLNFSSFKILKKQSQNGIYGVSMRQNYDSNSYSDEGYLFLLIDFNHGEPKIYVRSWQPREWADEVITTLSDFEINE